MIIVDTNVLSELMRPSPSELVGAWVSSHNPRELCTSAITLAEVRYGIERLPAGERKRLLGSTADAVFAAFVEQVLPFDHAAAAIYPSVVAGREQAGKPIDGFNAQIASICRARGAALATRNRRDFEGLGVELIDPWAARPDR